MRKFMTIGVAAVIAASGSAVGLTLLATAGPAGAVHIPAPITCSAIAGSTTIAVQVNPAAPSASVLSGCSGDKSTPYGLSVSFLLNPSPTAGNGTTTVTWGNKKTTTYNYAVGAAATPFTCPTFLGQTAYGQETITVTDVGGNAKDTVGGTFNVCDWVNFSDGSVYEASVGPVTI
jgi:hypothetical protein